MTELLSAQQMRDVEAAAIASGDVTGCALMERAGQGAVDAMMIAWPQLNKPGTSACVFCGPGNNGGDGFVIARLLAGQGWLVRVLMFGDADRLPPDAKANHARWAADHPVEPMTLAAFRAGPRPDVIIDAVFGIGLSRPLPEEVANTLDVKATKVWPRSYQIKRLAIDCPSGLDLDRGTIPTDVDLEIEGPWPKTLNTAHLTVTFHAPKLGHYLKLGPTMCGDLRVVDIGLQRHDPERRMLGLPPDPHRVRLVSPEHFGRPLPRGIWPGSHIAKARGSGHKFDHGSVFVFAGGVGRGGAGRLAARAALRVGAGLVTVICPPSALIENACHLSAVMLRSLAKDANVQDVVDDRATAFCLGPGMGVSDLTCQRVGEVLKRTASRANFRAPAVVLDADALTSFAKDPQALFARAHDRTILTPHAGEFDRLFPDLAQAMRAGLSKVDALRQAADRAGCIVLLKGPDTVIAAPGGGASVHGAVYDRTAPWLATAGAGDVLAGLIAGLAASPTSSELFVMAEIAVWLHVETARSFGPGLIAEDLPDHVPVVLRDYLS